MNAAVVAVLFLATVFATIDLFGMETAKERVPIREDDTDGDETTSEALSTIHPCHCTLISYGPDEMEGTVKSPGFPGRYCDDQVCLYEIEPNPEYSILVKVRTMQMEKRYDRLDMYYYAYVNGKREQIHFHNLGEEGFNIYTAPKGVGLFFNMSTDGSGSGRFLIEYERVDATSGLPGETGKVGCPYPFMQATSTTQNISHKGWLSSGCVFRLMSNHSILLRSKCTPVSYYTNVYVFAALPGENSQYWSFTNNDVYTRETQTADITAFATSFFGGRKLFDTCQLSFVALDYDPCNCSTTSFGLVGNEDVNISSPGYPQMYCKSIDCDYRVSRRNSTAGFKNAYLVKASHFAKTTRDTLGFYVNGAAVELMQRWSSDDEKEMIIVADVMTISYSASSIMSDSHGFSVNVKAIDVPSTCICPSNGVKKLASSGSFSATIPAECPDMHCRFEIPGDYRASFRMKIAYRFPHENEHLAVKAGNVVTKYGESSSALVNRKFNTFATESIGFVYRREGIDSDAIRIGDSSFNLTWHWIGRSDCSCDPGIAVAHPDEWEDLYSPKYPDSYCLNSNCVYNVQAPEGYHVVMNVTFFETEPHSDYLSFFDGFNQSTPHLLQLHGHVLTAPMVETTGRNASLLFTSDGSVVARGFVVAYKAVKDPVDEDPTSSGHPGLIVGMLFTMALVVTGGYFAYSRYKEEIATFINPVYAPPIHYSVSNETITTQNDESILTFN